MASGECEGFLVDLQRLSQLLSRQSKDYDVFRIGADFLSHHIENVCHISIALLTKMEESTYYFKLSTEPQNDHSYIGNMRLSDTASGVAIHKKHMVTTGEFRTSGTRYLDYLHFSQEDGAISMATMPLIIAEKAVGTINLASTRIHAFGGLGLFLEIFAAIVSPYFGLQSYTRQMVGVKSLLQRTLPHSIMECIDELREYPPCQGAAPLSEWPPPALSSRSRHSTYVPRVTRRLDPRIAKLLAAKDAKSEVVAPPTKCAAEVPWAGGDAEYVQESLPDMQFPIDWSYSVVCLVILFQVCWTSWKDDQTHLFCFSLATAVFCCLPLLALGADSIRRAYCKYRIFLVSAIRLLRAVISVLLQSPQAVCRTHNTIPRASYFIMDAIFYQVKASEHLFIQAWCLAIVVCGVWFQDNCNLLELLLDPTPLFLVQLVLMFGAPLALLPWDLYQKKNYSSWEGGKVTGLQRLLSELRLVPARVPAHPEIIKLHFGTGTKHVKYTKHVKLFDMFF
eukprot:jgi/Botrbrau1/19554/Bobra.0035s0046.1